MSDKELGFSQFLGNYGMGSRNDNGDYLLNFMSFNGFLQQIPLSIIRANTEQHVQDGYETIDLDVMRKTQDHITLRLILYSAEHAVKNS